jgi:transcriptional regulator with XRE-family HTH domain
LRNLINIINRLKEKFSLKNDTQVAHLLGVEQNTLSSWKKRNKIPYEKLDNIAIKYHISLDWILSGEQTYEEYQELINNLNTLSNEKKEIYILRIKADALEEKNKSS